MKQRLLVHGPRLADPGDLLFFDAWLWPTLQAVGVRSRLPPGDGMAIGETWPQPLLDALGAAGRTLPLPELTTELVTTSMPDVAGWLASGADPATAFSPAVAAAVGGIIAETMVAPSGCSGVHCLPNAGQSCGFFTPFKTRQIGRASCRERV